MREKTPDETAMIDHTVTPLDELDAARFALASLPDVPRLKPAHDALRFVGHACPMCGVALSPQSIRWAWVVPPVHAPARATGHADRFACCASCAVKRGAADLLECSLTHPGDLLDRRARLLQAGAHHPTRWRDRTRISAALSARVQQPRVTIVAAAGRDGSAVVGWSERSGGRTSLGALVHRLRAAHAIERIADGDPVMIGVRPAPAAVIFRVPAPHGLDALWTLIDAGALLRPAVPVVPSAENWKTAWSVIWTSMRQHHDRIDLQTLFPVPIPVRPYSDNASARRMRAARAR